MRVESLRTEQCYYLLQKLLSRKRKTFIWVPLAQLFTHKLSSKFATSLNSFLLDFSSFRFLVMKFHQIYCPQCCQKIFNRVKYPSMARPHLWGLDYMRHSSPLETFFSHHVSHSIKQIVCESSTYQSKGCIYFKINDIGVDFPVQLTNRPDVLDVPGYPSITVFRMNVWKPVAHS